MRLASSGRPPATEDVAAALVAAVGMLGQRPAITGHVLDRPGRDTSNGAAGGRREQGFASLAGWVAKGANLLAVELGLGVGDRLALAGPPGWPLAAVTLSAWWLGLTVVPAAGVSSDGEDPAVMVTHLSGLGASGAAAVGRVGASAASLAHFVLGDALDGTPLAEVPGDFVASVEPWTDAVTPHGDRPPPAAHDGDLLALVTRDGTAFTQRALLQRAGSDVGPDAQGVIGLLRDGDADLLAGADAVERLTALTLRPLVMGAATVVIDRDDPAREEHARSERVTRWLD